MKNTTGTSRLKKKCLNNWIKYCIVTKSASTTRQNSKNGLSNKWMCTNICSK